MLDGEYQCEYCQKDFTLKKNLNRHVLTCEKNPTYIPKEKPIPLIIAQIVPEVPESEETTTTFTMNKQVYSLIDFLKNEMSSDEQQLFVQNFKSYLEHDSETEFVIDLDSVYEWIGFSTIENVKRLLIEKFEENKHYKLPQTIENQNKQILLTINCFKKLCLKIDTKRTDEIHDYYIKLENASHKYVEFQNQQKLRLQKHNLLIENYKEKPVIYCSEIVNSGTSEVFRKFGRSNNIANRYLGHRSEFGNENIYFQNVYECNDNVQAERLLRQHPLIANNVVTMTINGKEHTELIRLDSGCTEEVISKVMEKITKQINTKTNESADSTRIEIEKERTKQIEEIEKTKQMQLELEIKKMELEILKLNHK